MPKRILVVDADPIALHRIDGYLSDDGYWVSAASSFQLARKLLEPASPDLLVAAIRLGAFNGLHLASLGRFRYPSLPVIITHVSHDPVLEDDAQRLGAIFIVNPLEDSQFLQQVRGVFHEGGRVPSAARLRPR